MTLGEYRFWLEGYMEDRGKAPTKEEWEKIQAKLDEVESDPCDRPHYYPWYPYPSIPAPFWQEGTDSTTWTFTTNEDGNGDDLTLTGGTGTAYTSNTPMGELIV